MVIRIWNAIEIWEKLILNLLLNYLMTGGISFYRAVKNHHLLMLLIVSLKSSSRRGQIISQIYTQRDDQFQQDPLVLLIEVSKSRFINHKSTYHGPYLSAIITRPLIKGIKKIKTLLYVLYMMAPF